MPPKKKVISSKSKTSEIVDSIKNSAKIPISKAEINYRKTISTGSTLLDLAISGGRCRTGGIPGGIIVEIFGQSSAGKSSILSEIGAHAQAKGGEVVFKDPEARLDVAYCKIHGLNIDKSIYSKPDTVSQVFEELSIWKPSENKGINAICVDSLAALSTNLEMSEKGDKMGMRRAKEFSEGFRKYCRIIEKNQWIMACSNQLRQGDYGDIAPGGNATGFYSSLRIKLKIKKKVEVEKTLKSGRDLKRPIGIESECVVVKSSIDNPYRTAPIYIIFNYGIDDIRANLQYIKDMERLSMYRAIDKEYQAMSHAIAYIEKNNLQDMLKEEVIELWNIIENLFQVSRTLKIRK